MPFDGIPEPLCLWCQHFDMEIGRPAWSDVTPGEEFEISCSLNHWEWLRGNDENDYRACIIRARSCPDYRLSEGLLDLEPAPTPSMPEPPKPTIPYKPMFSVWDSATNRSILIPGDLDCLPETSRSLLVEIATREGWGGGTFGEAMDWLRERR